ncbi:MAG TPA: class I SAM-dependent methyltransferase [Candidatus Merdenecus merdavium]|nr:class I SAM-dependent methyltransferase [Candidatus Merdenecus merdavium]
MVEKIGNVKLNYEFYKGTDHYSDGDIEDELLKYVEESEDVLKILKNDNRWPILYHLSPVRQNILDWYPIGKDSQVLEIGAGCGAITGVLCKKAKNVTCIDLSKRRSLINANRNKRYDNLEIMVGNFNDIILEEKYDYITLIGVLEYAAYYTDSERPFVTFLENIKKMLKPGGKVLIAIENKFGLKYWGGAREDHTSVYFDGLEGYHHTGSKVRTFSKTQLTQILHQAGFFSNEFYYPYPDYKFPQQIFSNEYLPKHEDIIISMGSYDKDRLRLFDENLVFGEIIEEEMFDFFTNSFFVEAGMD